MVDHEYSVVGHSRSKIGMFIASVAGVISGGITILVGLFATYLSSRQIDLPDVILWPITGAVIFSLLFAIFNKYLWRITRLRNLLGVPNFEGKWEIRGKSYDANNAPKTDWFGFLEITQCYEKITVHMQTKRSSSKSVSAAILNEGRVGFRLIYSYKNQPDAGQQELAAHLGHCDLLFDESLNAANGNYFTGGGRYTHGTMELIRLD